MNRYQTQTDFFAQMTAICQKCLTVIIIDPSLIDRNPFKRISTLSSYSKVRSLSLLFNSASQSTAQLDIDHPLCQYCYDGVIRNMNDNIAELNFLEDQYQNQLDLQDIQDTIDDIEYNSYIQIGLRQEKQLEADLNSIRQERKIIQDRLRIESAKRIILSQQLNKILYEYYQNQEDIDSNYILIKTKLDNLQKRINELDCHHPLNDLFHIWLDGHFGTINNCRLGRFDTINVNWIEINAACTFVVKLMETLANILQINFTQWKVLPYGAFLNIKENIIYTLSIDAHMTFSQESSYQKFDKAIIGLMHCLSEILTCLNHHFPDFGLTSSDCKSMDLISIKMSIDKSKIITISAYCLQLSSNAWINWTKAWKYTLMILKYCILYAVKFMYRFSQHKN